MTKKPDPLADFRAAINLEPDIEDLRQAWIDRDADVRLKRALGQEVSNDLLEAVRKANERYQAKLAERKK